MIIYISYNIISSCITYTTGAFAPSAPKSISCQDTLPCGNTAAGWTCNGEIPWDCYKILLLLPS